MTLSSFLALSAIILTGIPTHAVSQDRSNLPIPDPVFKGKIGLTPADSVKDFPQAVTPPEGAQPPTFGWRLSGERFIDLNR